MLRLFALFSFCLAVFPLRAEEPRLTTYKFHEFQLDGVPKGWTDDTAWADVDLRFGSDRTSEEQQVSAITLKAVRRGYAQIRGPYVPIKAGMVYTVRVHLRSKPAMPVMVSVRESKPPFRDYSLRQTAESRSDWSTQSFTFEGKKTSSDQQLLIGFREIGTVWLESVQIIEETREQFAARSSKAAAVGNRLANGDFRLGNFGWDTFGIVDRRLQYPRYTGRQYSLDTPVLRTVRVDGRETGALALSQFPAVLVSDLFDVEPGAAFQCTARVRRQKGTGKVKLRLFSPAWTKAPSVTREVGAEWTDLPLAGRVPVETGIQLRTELTAAGEGDLEIAGVRFVQRPSQSPDGGGPAFGVVADRRLTAYEEGETPALTLRAAGLDKTSKTVAWQLVDSRGKILEDRKWEIGGAVKPVTLPGLKVGWYRLRWSAPWAENLKEGSLSIAVVPKAGRKDGPASPWGIHVEGNDLGVRKMRLLGARWLRTNNPLWTKWTAVEPERGTWVFPDESVDKFIDAGMDIIGNLDRTPKWAARNPSDDRPGTDYHGYKADLPNDWPAWEEYVRQMVRRYRGKISYWEVWNEPDITFLNPPKGMTNAEAYLQLLEHSAPVIKAEDPGAKIVMSPAYVLKKRSNPEGYQPDFTERLIEAGGLKFIDIFGFHYYFQPHENLFDHPDRYEAAIARVRKAMKEAGKKQLVWDTEWGIIDFTLPANHVSLPGNNGLTPDRAAQELVSWSVAQLAAGVEKLFWYDGMDNFYYSFHVTRSFFDYGQPRPIFVAYALLTKTLDGLRYDARGSQTLRDGRLISFRNEERQVLVAYAKPGKTTRVRVPEGAAAIDYLGRELKPGSDDTIPVTEGPVYLVKKGR